MIERTVEKAKPLELRFVLGKSGSQICKEGRLIDNLGRRQRPDFEHHTTALSKYIGGQPPCKPSKQLIWFVPVRCVRVIGIFRGGGFPNPVQTKFGHEQTLTKPDFVTTKPNANQLLRSLNHGQTYSEVCSFCVKPCPNQCR